MDGATEAGAVLVLVVAVGQGMVMVVAVAVGRGMVTMAAVAEESILIKQIKERINRLN